MTTLDVIENKISAVQKYLKILERYKQFSRKTIEKDIDLRGALERYLYLAVQSTIDLAEAVISYRDFRKPSAMSETFYILHEEKIISSALAEKMARMAGFRNIIAHDYEKLDYGIVYDVLQRRLKDVAAFLAKISAVMKKY